MRINLYILAIGIILSSPVLGDTMLQEDWSQALMHGSFKINDAKARHFIASSFANKIKLLNNEIPELSSSELKDIEDKEESAFNKDGSLNKSNLEKLVKTPSYHQKIFKEKLKNIEKALVCAGSDKSSQEQEMYCWALANFHLAECQDINGLIKVLNKEKILVFSQEKSQLFMLYPDKEQPWWAYGVLARSIQEKIVLRYLSRKISQGN